MDPAAPAPPAKRSIKVEVRLGHLLRLRALKITGQGTMSEHIDAALEQYFARLPLAGPGLPDLAALAHGQDEVPCP
jgi:hypothetical protein